MKKSELIVAFARSQVGEPYDLGDHGPDKWDCSGLTMEAVELIGLKWPHSSHRQYYMPELVEKGKRANLVRGRTCFLFNYGTRTNGQKGYVHVGIYDGVRDTVIQAGGYNDRGTIDSQGYGGKGVHEDPVSGHRFKPLDHFSDWGALRGADDEIPHDVVKNGSSGAAVAVLQLLLRANGATLEVDGKFGPITDSALKAFQSEHGLEANGICGPETWARVDSIEYPSNVSPDTSEAVTGDSTTKYSTLRRGSSGELVKTLQNLLNQNGATLEVDGKFGPLTDAAVRAYQKANGLTVDGITGPITWGELTK